MSRTRTRTLLTLAALAISVSMFATPAIAVPIADPIPVDGLDHAFTGTQYLSMEVKQGKLYSVSVTGEGYDFNAWSYLMDADGTQLTDGHMFYGSIPRPQGHIFWYAPPADETVYLKMQGLPSFKSYVVRATENDFPEITGKVSDFKTGEPVAGALVRAWLEPLFNGLTFAELPFESTAATSATTAADGTYRIVLPRPGTIMVRFDDPAGGRLGEWYESTPRRMRYVGGMPSANIIKPVALDSALKAGGIDGVVAAPGTIRLRFVRNDTGASVPGVLPRATAFDTVGAVSGLVDLPWTDVTGETTLTGDPRLRYEIGGYFVPGDVVLESSPVFTPLPDEAISHDVTLAPEWIKTVSDAKAAYADVAEIKLIRSGNINIAGTYFRLDDAESWELADYLGLIVTVTTPGPHHLKFYSFGYNDMLTEQVASSDFVITCGTRWSDIPTLTVAPGYRRPVILKASLKRSLPSSTHLAGEVVNVESSSNGVDSWRSVGTTRTTDDGEVRWSTSCTTATYYRFRYLGRPDYYAASTSASVKVLPVASVGNPIAPGTMYKGKTSSTYGFLKPRHTSGTYPVRIYKYKYASGKWTSYGYVRARASNYSTYTKYVGSISLPSAGRWRIRAFAPADAGHAATWSSGYDYITVK